MGETKDQLLRKLKPIYGALQKIIDAHPESVHQLLKSKGITKQATPEVLVNAFVVYGDEIVVGLQDIVGTSNYIDMTTAVNQAAQSSQTSQTSSSPSTGTKVGDTLLSAAVLANQLDRLFNPSKYPVNSQGGYYPTNNSASLQDYKKTESDKNAKTLLYIGIAVIVVIVIAIVIVKRAKQ